MLGSWKVSRLDEDDEVQNITTAFLYDFMTDTI